MKVFDSSAILAMTFGEPGADTVAGWIAEGDGLISTVNLSEVLGKLHERGLEPDKIEAIQRALPLAVVPLDVSQAIAAAKLRLTTHELGLSLGDRCCLALAQQHDADVVTTDRIWSRLSDFRVSLPH